VDYVYLNYKSKFEKCQTSISVLENDKTRIIGELSNKNQNKNQLLNELKKKRDEVLDATKREIKSYQDELNEYRKKKTGFQLEQKTTLNSIERDEKELMKEMLQIDNCKTIIKSYIELIKNLRDKINKLEQSFSRVGLFF
jgi:chromosome segregation ATPase